VLDGGALADLMPAWLAAVAGAAPATLADASRVLADVAPTAWAVRLGRYLAAPAEAADDPIALFVCESLVQPFAAVVALEARPEASPAGDPAAAAGPTANALPAACPCCGGAPVCGVLHERGHGAGRALVCGTCATAWPAPRLVCPACGAVEVQALPVFRAEAWPAIRLDACDACGTYVKSVDLTVDGHAVAVVDDIATVALDVWAGEHGYRKIRPNVLRM
jgi:FdhE protein